MPLPKKLPNLDELNSSDPFADTSFEENLTDDFDDAFFEDTSSFDDVIFEDPDFDDSFFEETEGEDLTDLSDEDIGNVHDEEFSLHEDPFKEHEDVYEEEPEEEFVIEKPKNKKVKVKKQKLQKPKIEGNTLQRLKKPIIISVVIVLVVIIGLILSTILTGQSSEPTTSEPTINEEDSTEIVEKASDVKVKIKKAYIEEGLFFVDLDSNAAVEVEYIDSSILTEQGIVRCFSSSFVLPKGKSSVNLEDCDNDISNVKVKDTLEFVKLKEEQ